VRLASGEAKGYQKTKKEREADEAAAREAALATSLDTSNKGFKLMTKLGYKPGTALGKASDARTEPIGLIVKEDRGGIGLDSEKKRKFREEIEQEVKKVKVEQGGYRDRLRQEREERRLEAQFIAAQKVAERLDTETEEEEVATQDRTSVSLDKRPLKSINLLWRGLIRHRLEQEAERRMRADLQQGLSAKLPTYDDPDEDNEDKQAYMKKSTKNEFVEEDLEEEDHELDEFSELPPAERLEKLVLYLRSAHHYCFWCKYAYPDALLEGCPGTTEEDHD